MGSETVENTSERRPRSCRGCRVLAPAGARCLVWAQQLITCPTFGHFQPRSGGLGAKAQTTHTPQRRRRFAVEQSLRATWLADSTDVFDNSSTCSCFNKYRVIWAGKRRPKKACGPDGHPLPKTTGRNFVLCGCSTKEIQRP